MLLTASSGPGAAGPAGTGAATVVVFSRRDCSDFRNRLRNSSAGAAPAVIAVSAPRPP